MVYKFTSIFEAERNLRGGNFLGCQTVFGTRSLVKDFKQQKFIMSEGTIDKSQAELFWSFDTAAEALEFLNRGVSRD